MSKVKISYKTARKKNPAIVSELMKAIKHRKSKSKNNKPGSFTWGIEWAEIIRSNDMSTMRRENTVDYMVNYRLQNIEGNLFAKSGKNTWRSVSYVVDKSDIRDVITEEEELVCKKQSCILPTQQDKLSSVSCELNKYDGLLGRLILWIIKKQKSK